MPVMLDVDWKLAKSLFMSGLTTREIARQLGINLSTVHSRCGRDQWALERSKCAVAVSQKHLPIVEMSRIDRGKRALEGILSDAEHTVRVATEKLKEPKNWSELATKENAMGALTKRVMLASGLDQPNSTLIIDIGHLSNLSTTQSVSPVIDIESSDKSKTSPSYS